MADVTIYGFAPSTYTRAARMACIEKGVPHHLESLDMKSDEYKRLHPFQKIPAFRHGELILFEASAIAQYVDEAFAGPPLQPSDPAGRARQQQWISAIVDYMYRPMVVDVVIERLVVPSRGGKTDEHRIEAAKGDVERYLDVLDGVLDRSPFLAGSERSIADLMLFPIADYLVASPDVGDATRRRANLLGWYQAMADRESARATKPALG